MKLNVVLVVLTTLLGAISALPIAEVSSNLESRYCEPALLDERFQNDVNDVPLCEKLSEERIAERGQFCKDGKLYSLQKRESCINRIIFFPFFPWIENMHPDAGLAIIPLIIIYGGVVGCLIGLLISFII